MTTTPATVATVNGFLPSSVAKVAVAEQPEPLPRLSLEEESNIRAWLAHIEETDPIIIAEMMDKCRNDGDAHRYFLKRSEGVSKPTIDNQSVLMPEPEPSPIELIDQAMADLSWLAEDKSFVRSQLARLGIYGQQRRRVLEQYREIWLEASEREHSLIKKENVGRKTANAWLRDL